MIDGFEPEPRRAVTDLLDQKRSERFKVFTQQPFTSGMRLMFQSGLLDTGFSLFESGPG